LEAALADNRAAVASERQTDVLQRLMAMRIELDLAIEGLRATMDQLNSVSPQERSAPALVVVKRFTDRAQRVNASPIDELTPREREVLALIARGKSNRAIADDQTHTKRAVEKHLGSIFMKLMLEDEDIVSRRVAAVLLDLSTSGDPSLAEPFLTVRERFGVRR
jgi:DNA-binding NarL/FixJ family response regulator